MECPDADLVARFKAGELQAFELLFRRYEKPVLGVTARMVGNADDAEDLKQEAFVRAYRSLGSFAGRCKFSTWLFRIAANLCLDHLKRKRIPARQIDEAAETGGWELLCGTQRQDPAREAERSELQAEVARALAEVPPHYRILLVLRHMEDLPYEEIASIVGCSVHALNVRLHRARQALKSRMMGYVDGDRPEAVT